MTNWLPQELELIGTTDELQLAILRQDGTLRRPVTIWVVRVGNDLYVRAYRGHETAWFRQAQRRPQGRITAGRVTKDVALIDASADEALGNEIDAAYQKKYHKYSATYVRPMIAASARATTLKLKSV